MTILRVSCAAVCRRGSIRAAAIAIALGLGGCGGAVTASVDALDPGTPDFKPSALKFLKLADAVVAHASAAAANFGDRPVFAIQPPHYVTPEIVDWVRLKLP